MTWLPFAAAFLLGVFGLAIFAAVREFGRWIRADRERHEREVARLHAENAKLLATALESKGVILRDPAQPARTVEVANPVGLQRKISGGLIRLEREASQKSIDRDARVAAEIEEANRVARGMRADA
jgi:hypothetical protein